MNSFKLSRTLNTKTLLSKLVRSSSATIRQQSAADGLNSLSDEGYDHEIKSDCEFWAKQAENLKWFRRWDRVLDNSKPPFTRWFVGGTMNTCYNAVDRHIEEGFGDQIAIFYDSPLTNTKKAYTYNEVYKEVNALARALWKQGVRPGHVVLIYMPMVPQAIFTMLASARIGAIHSMIFSGYVALQLSGKIFHSKPKVIVTSSTGFEPGREIAYLPIVREALKLADFSPQSIIVYSRPSADGHTVVDYDQIVAPLMASNQTFDPVPVQATDPIYVIYTSGTSGDPKAPVRPSGGNAVALKWSMGAVYNVKPGEPYGAIADLSSVVGHSYTCYGPLLNRNPTVLYEGRPVGTPDAGAIFRLIDEYKLACIFVSPAALSNIRLADPDGEKAASYSLNSLRAVFSACQHLDSSALLWARERFGYRPVIDHWSQTEVGWAMLTSSLTPKGGVSHFVAPPMASCGHPTPGWHIEVVRDDLTKCRPFETGTIVARLPLPPGSLSTLFRSDKKFVETYFKKFPGYYDSADSGYKDKFGNVYVMGRVDTDISIAGQRMSSGAIEEAILLVDEVAEAAVVGRQDALKGQIPFAVCTLKPQARNVDHDVVVKKISESVRKYVGTIATLSGGILIVPRLPKTKNGKIIRKPITAMVNSWKCQIPAAIEDPDVLFEIANLLKEKHNIGDLPPEENSA